MRCKARPLLLLAMLLLPALPVSGKPISADQAASLCKRHLQAIRAALKAFVRDHHQLPDQLSDLFPHYLPDRSVFHCPDDPTPGEPGSGDGHADPRQPISYSYEMSAGRSNGLACPLGPFPASDLPGGGWGTERLVNLHQRRFFGDRVPIMRCFHHQRPGEPPSAQPILNLTLEGNIYTSSLHWEDSPGTVAVVLQRARYDLRANVAVFARDWKVGRLEEYSYDWLDPALPAPVLNAMHEVAALLERHALEIPDEPAAYRLAARYYCTSGDFRRAIVASRKALALPNEGENERARLILAESYRGAGRLQDALVVYTQALAKNPESRSIKFMVADTYAALGRRREAESLRAQADPGRDLVGTAAPEFDIPNVAGGKIALRDALQGKKALLVNFWFLH